MTCEEVFADDATYELNRGVGRGREREIGLFVLHITSVLYYVFSI